MKRMYILFISILLLGWMGNTFAQPADPSRFRGERSMRERPLGIPDLTEDQMEQIKDLNTAHLKDIQSLENDLKINKSKLDALMTEDNPDMNEINSLIEKNGDLLTEIQKKNVAHKLEIRSLLTDEQKVYFDNRMPRLRHGLREDYRMNRRFNRW